MSATHTQGPLVLGQHGAIRGGPMVSYINGSAQAQVAMTTGAVWMVQGEHIENARRLVACWNACENLPTDFLEVMSTFAVNHMLPTYARAIDQRDELLAALKAARKSLQVANDTTDGPIRDTIWHGPAETLFDFMDAAIAKVEGGAA